MSPQEKEELKHNLKQCASNLDKQGIMSNLDKMIKKCDQQEKHILLKSLLMRAVDGNPALDLWEVDSKEQQRVDIVKLIIEKDEHGSAKLTEEFVAVGGLQTSALKEVREKINNFSDKQENMSETKRTSYEKIKNLLEGYKNKFQAAPSTSPGATYCGNERFNLHRGQQL